MSHSTDAQNTIVNRLRAAGTEELSSLFEANRDNLRTLISQRIQGTLAARFDASDIIQETFIRANKQLRSYLRSPQLHPVVWIRVLCKNLLSESIRKHMRNRRSPVYETHNVGDQLVAERLADSIHSVRETVVRRELVQRVYDLLSTFGQTDREIIEMRHTDMMSFPEIAKCLEMGVEAVKKRYYRGLDKFRTLDSE